MKLTERYADFAELTPAILNEFISRIEVHERDQKRARYAIQHIGIYFNHIGKFENELTQLAEPTEHCAGAKGAGAQRQDETPMPHGAF